VPNRKKNYGCQGAPGTKEAGHQGQGAEKDRTRWKKRPGGKNVERVVKCEGTKQAVLEEDDGEIGIGSANIRREKKTRNKSRPGGGRLQSELDQSPKMTARRRNNGGGKKKRRVEKIVVGCRNQGWKSVSRKMNRSGIYPSG